MRDSSGWFILVALASSVCVLPASFRSSWRFISRISFGTYLSASASSSAVKYFFEPARRARGLRRRVDGQVHAGRNRRGNGRGVVGFEVTRAVYLSIPLPPLPDPLPRSAGAREIHTAQRPVGRVFQQPPDWRGTRAPGCEDQRSEITFDLMPDSRSDTENEKPPLLAWRGGGGFRARKTLLLLQPGRLRDLLGQVLLLLLEPLAEHEPREAADLDVLADLRDRVGEDLLDLLLVVLHEELLDEAVRLVELLELAGRDLLEDRLGLLLIAHLGLRDLELLRDELRRDLLAADPQRRGGRDLHRDVLHERLEPLGARDEVRLAVHLDEHPDLAAHVDVARDGALGRGARRLLRGGGEPLLAEQLLGLHEVAARLCEHLLAVHHPRPGLLPELLHELRADLGHLESPRS